MLLALLAACAPAPSPAPPRAGSNVQPAPPELPGVPSPLPNRVVVVGAGVSGMSAAIEVLASGADVVVLEREEDLVGGAANDASLMIFSGSSEQAASGVSDSPEQLLAEWPSFTGGDVSDAWVQRFAEENVPDVHDWLQAMGVGWNGPAEDPSAGQTARIHSINGGGAELVTLLRAHLPDDAVWMGVEATGLAQDASGRVVGVEWRDVATGEVGELRGRGVVVATGGFGWSLEKVREVRPELADVVLTHASWEGADGNGLDMLLALGAATQNLAAVGLYSHALRCPTDATVEMPVPFQFDVPWVDLAGSRFVDETLRNDFHSAEAIVDSGGAAWMIFDAPLVPGGLDCHTDPYSFVDWGDMGAVEGDDPEGLADALGVDGAAVAAELAAYNAAVDAQGGDAWRSSMTTAWRVDEPPYYALPVAVSVAKMFGGIDVDLDGRVLRADGGTIPGLYAAGELTGMAGGSLVGDAGFTGSLSAVVLGGRVAGRHAATDRVFR